MFTDITDGLNHCKLLVACVSDDYLNSDSCKKELRFGVNILQLPTIIAMVGTGNAWESKEVGHQI